MNTVNNGVSINRDDLPQRGRLVDYGVTIDRGDHVIVLLDALGPDQVQKEIDAICAMLGAGQPQQSSAQTRSTARSGH